PTLRAPFVSAAIDRAVFERPGECGTLSRTAHRLLPQAESPALATARAANAGRRLSERPRDLPLTRFAPRQGRLSLIPLLNRRHVRRTRVRFPPPPLSLQVVAFRSE